MTTAAEPLPEKSDDEEMLFLRGSTAARRALDYYLKDPVSDPPPGEGLLALKPGVSSEEALVHASDLLRSAAAIAYELANNKLGEPRDLAFSVVYLIDMAKAMLERPPRLSQSSSREPEQYPGAGEKYFYPTDKNI